MCIPTDGPKCKGGNIQCKVVDMTAKGLNSLAILFNIINSLTIVVKCSFKTMFVLDPQGCLVSSELIIKYN